MKQKTHKTDVRIYIDDEYKSYLKMIADKQNTSVNRLIMELVEKKYPFNKKAKALLKNAFASDFVADGEQVSLVAPSLTSSTAVDDVALESVETHSTDVEDSVAPEEDTICQEDARKEKERRLADINYKLKRAYNGETLPNDEYHRLKQEQSDLRAELNHN